MGKSLAPLSMEQYLRDRRDMKMSTKIRVVAVVASAAALTGGVAFSAQAASKVVKVSRTTITTKSTVSNVGVANPMANQMKSRMGWTGALAALVTKGTITQAQADAITSAYNAAEAAEKAWDAAATKSGTRPDDSPAAILADLVKKGTISQAVADAITAALPAGRPGMPGRGPGFPNFNKLNIISTTLGIDTPTLIAKVQAGASLATIAGDKKAALIAALVADETKQIDAAVAAGKLTADQATTLKAGLVAHITAEVEESPARIGGRGPRGPKVDGDHDGPRGPIMGGKGGRGGHGHGHGMGGEAPSIPGAVTTALKN